MSASFIDRPWAVVALAVVATALAALIGLFTPPDILSPWLVENGPVEFASFGLHLLAMAAALAAWRLGAPLAPLLAMGSLLMALREIDAQSAFTHYSVFSTKMYVYPGPSLMERILSGAGVLTVLGLTAGSIWLSRDSIRRLRRDRSAALFGLMGFVGFAIALKAVDNLPRELRKLDLTLNEAGLSVVTAVEEIGEMALPLLTLVLLVQLLRTSARQGAATTQV